MIKEFIDGLLKKIVYIENTYVCPPTFIKITEFIDLCNFIKDESLSDEYIKKFSDVAELAE